ncbi:hypothetical protein P3T24_006544 [Paraburkholderia sp. GAS33]|uniref:helix-turn-helix transcriptional regulator n=1 Tax=Paraburkholderia sp. GAS33 TaxID=3035130 RepID=UPI003D1AFCC3
MKSDTSMPAVQGVLYESTDSVLEDRVHLRLDDGGDGRCLLTRELIRGDGIRFSQAIDIGSSAALYDFATSDPYAALLRGRYEALLRRIETRKSPRLSPSLTVEGAIGAIDRISDCQTEGELLQTVRSIVRCLGASQFVYQWLRFEGASVDDTDAVESRYLIGCRPSWMQQYVARLWFMNDPFVTYARTSVAPALSSGIHVHRADHWLVTEGRSQGFNSGIVAPAHLRGSGLVGLLFVSNPESPVTGDPKLWQHRVLFRALSSELLDWRVVQLRREASATYGLSESELLALKTLHDGGMAEHVAERLGISKNAVYQRVYRSIDNKMGVAHIADAVEKASALGLLG